MTAASTRSSSSVYPAMLAKAGYTELEERVDAAVMARRVLAGVLMVLAIVCYNWGRW